MSRPNVHANLSMREAVRIALELGCAVTPVPATDEVRISHPTWPRSLNLKSTRHDAGRKLVGRLRQLAKAASTKA